MADIFRLDNDSGTAMFSVSDAGVVVAAGTITDGTGQLVDATTLASVANGAGASMVGVEDSGGNFTGTDVEAVLAELYTAATTGGSDSITDTNTYYTTDTIDGALDALGVQIGGDTDATYAFGESNVVANNDAVYAAINKLDLKWGDLASTANGEGAALVAIEDSGALITATTVEGALAENRTAIDALELLVDQDVTSGAAPTLLSTNITGAGGQFTITDTNTYYTTDTVNGALDALAAQIGGTSDAAYGFSEDNVLTDNDTVYAALNKLDLKWGDLASTANGEGAALVGVEDSAGNFAAATVEAILAELAARTPGLAPSTSFVLFDDFVYQTITEADTNWVLNSGSDPQAADPAIASGTAGGVLEIVCGDANGGIATDGSQVVSSIPVQAQSGGVAVEVRLKINTSVANAIVNVGFTDVTTLEMPATIGGGDAITTNASDAAVFVYDSAADTDQWFAVAVDSDVDDTGNAATGTAPTADTYQVLRIELSSDGATVTYKINGSTVTTLSGDAGVSPDVNLYASVTVDTNTTASQTVHVDYIRIESLRA